MRVLGIDPGSQITGIGVIDVQASDLRLIHAESLRLPKAKLDLRLHKIYQRLSEVLAKARPDIVVMEKVFLARNPQSALVLGHARGAAMLAAVNQGIEICEYSATEIKKTIVGRGRADKNQVQHMVRVLLKLRANPEEDAADALAAAICFAHHQKIATAIDKAMS